MAIGDAGLNASWQRQVEAMVRQAIALETKLDERTLSNDTSFEEYGIESVMVVAITRRLEETFGELAKTLFFEFQSIGELAAYLAEEYPQAATATPAAAPAPAATTPAVAPVAVSVAEPVVHAAPAYIPPVMPAPAPQAAASSIHRSDDIAIIGMSGRFPMADTMEQFWENLTNGRNCISEVPPELWDWREIWTTEKGVEGKSYTRWGGFMNDIDKFDPLFFNISNLEANSLDPQERLFLQTVYHTIEDAGYAREHLSGRKIGVYAGAMWGQYQLYGVETANAGSSYSSIANRVSYYFNFTGPSIGLDTMCSSSLTTVHLACESLKRGETELAIAGGVNITTHPNKYLFLSKTGFASTEGLCRSYGDGGDGYVPGDGVGALLLKPLAAAERDGDRIYGVIRGSAINHGGKANAYTVPNPKLQATLIRDALQAANVDPRTISYIEGHGTGTALGDPIEVRALTQAFTDHTSDTGYCALGSVKSNIGHLESAAGFAGIAKVLLQMRHRQLVPSIHAETLNPNIDFSKTPFVVQRTLSPWNPPVMRENGRDIRVPRRAGISSFGAGGANAHVIIEEYTGSTATAVRQPEARQLFVFSAKNHEQLHAVVRQFLASLTPSATLEASAAQDAGEVLGSIANVLGISAQLLDAADRWSDLALVDSVAEALARQLNQGYGCALNATQVREAASFGQLSTQVFGGASLSATGNDAERFERIAYTLQVGREALPRRLALEAENFAELRDKLERFLGGDDGIDACWTSPRSQRDRVQADGEHDAEFLRSMVEGRRWNKLGRLWCQGANVPWMEGYRGLGIRRIDLPLYPFARERCWVQTAAQPVAPAMAAAPAGLAAYLNPQRSIGGSLHFDLPAATGGAMTILGQAADYFQGVHSLAAVRWRHGAADDAAAARSLDIGAGSPWPLVRLTDTEQALAGSAELRPADGGNQPVSAPTDVAGWHSRCDRSLTPMNWPAGQAGNCALTEVGSGDGFALAHYRLSGAGAKPWASAAALLDAAIAVAGAAGMVQDYVAGVECRADRLALIGEPGAEGYLFIRAGQAGSLSVDVLDREGRITVSAQGAGIDQSDPLFERMFYQPRWIDASATELAPAAPVTTGATLLVYPAAAAFVASALKERIKGQVHEIVLATKTEVLSERAWSVSPDDEMAIPACMQHVGQVGTVYFLGGLNIDQWHPRTSKEFRALQNGSVNVLLRVVQAIESANTARQRWALRAVTNAIFNAVDGDIIQPFTAGVAGLAKALPNELPHVSSQLFDLALPEGSQELSPALLADLDRVVTGVADGVQLALRAGRALRRTLLPAVLPPAAAPQLKNDGVYLIVGGAGNVGVRISQYLASHCDANIAWIGRRAADDEIAAKLAAIDSSGARVRYYAADVSDDKKLAKAITQVESELGALRGVFHSAMTFAGGRLATLTEEDFNNALQAKTAGSHALYRALRGKVVDFLMFFSSGESFVGNKGWGAYTVACNFQDAFALHLRQETEWPVHVINWGFWEGNDRGDPELLRAKGIFPLNAEQGGEAIMRLVASGQGQVMALNVSDAVLQRMGVQLPERQEKTDMTAFAVTAVSAATPAAAPTPVRQAAEQASQVIGQIAQQSKVGHVQAALTEEAVAHSVRAIVADTLMIEREKIDLDADLADFGVDSLIVVNLHRALEELAGTLPATLFLNYQSVREVAQFLIANHVEQAGRLLGGGVAAGEGAEATAASAPANTSIDATAAITTKPAASTTDYAGAKLLRRIPGNEIEQFLFGYGDQYRDGQLAVTGEAPGSAQNASPDDLQHWLIDVPSCPQVEVFVTGQGTPLLFMPAVALTVPVWLQQILSLRSQYRLIVIHAPGYGLSKGIRAANTAGVSQVFSEVLSVVQPDQPVHLVSSCFGSIAASHLARFHADQVASLTMVGGFYDGADLPPVAGADLSIDEIMQMIQVVSGSLKQDFDTVAAQWDENDARRQVTERMGGLLIGSQCANPLVAMRYLNEMMTLSTLDWVGELRQPVQFLYGDLDTVIRPVHSQTMHAHLAGSDLVEISGSGHYPFLTHSAEFDRLLTAFLHRIGAGAAAISDTPTVEGGTHA
ncbi:SDR family oxidoreductase [Duganella sp. CY15W]|uniref:alpha/beta fold hydrolase n=1 Tax=Duganella sp. CY15W TaxID=2692172 RepID=UPI00136BA2B3|nr:alpha/beta fold hydrolase [Duganella sp. CY15W]MYM28266.1 SDR family oxidoreductase [Duganella sp. CY15W]